MNTLFSNTTNFASLSLKDLLSARSLFHYHLLSKKNVGATAVGLYRIRKSDPWPDHTNPNPKPKKKTKRTLFNSEVRPYSWPCIYVFVYDWMEEEKLSAVNPSDVVPKTLYLPDGRTVPVCVIEAQKQLYSDNLKVNMQSLFPRNVLMPGSPIINPDAQGLPRVATVGGIVKDGEKFYAITNKHAVGEKGNSIEGVMSNQTIPIGFTAKKSITRKPFSEVYPHFPGENQFLNMDIGLVELNDITKWKTEIMKFGVAENVLDLYDNNITLKLIGMKVVGFGAISGELKGEIQGLFYRYKSQGGYEFISDFLIGPRSLAFKKQGDSKNEELTKEDANKNKTFSISHGDSGTLLLIEQDIETDEKEKKVKTCYYPFALLWGKNEFIESGNRLVQPFALATSLSTALESLELDFVRDINLDNDLVWGYIGHYAIASKLKFTIDLVGSKKLKAFIEKNEDLLSMADDDIKSAKDSPRVVQKDADGNYDPDNPQFVPLADVPDNVWKSNVNLYMTEDADGKKQRHAGPGSRGQFDNPNHFADIDLPRDSDNQTLLQLSLANDFSFLTPANWLSFYKEVAPKYKAWSGLFEKPNSYKEKKHWGALPFRVKQITDAMIDYASKGKQNEFLCAGGVLIHYIGDACQPLHSSYKSQGDVDHPEEHTLKSGKNAGTKKTVMRGDKVHGGYEDDMVTAYSGAIMSGLEAEITKQDSNNSEKIRPITSGLEAAKAIIELIDATRTTLLPDTIIDKWVEVQAIKGVTPRNDEMWKDLGGPTIEVMARGCRVLAAVWQGAWEQGGGETKIAKGTVCSKEDMEQLYNDAHFLPSFSLDKY